MTARQRGAIWYADFMINGTRYRESFETKAEAEAWELEARAALKVGKPVPSPKPLSRKASGKTIQEVLEEAIELHWGPKRDSSKTILNAQNFVKWVGPLCPAHEALSQERIDAFTAHLMKKKKGRGGATLSTNTINKYMSAIKGLMVGDGGGDLG